MDTSSLKYICLPKVLLVVLLVSKPNYRFLLKINRMTWNGVKWSISQQPLLSKIHHGYCILTNAETQHWSHNRSRSCTCLHYLLAGPEHRPASLFLQKRSQTGTYLFRSTCFLTWNHLLDLILWNWLEVGWAALWVFGVAWQEVCLGTLESG